LLIIFSIYKMICQILVSRDNNNKEFDIGMSGNLSIKILNIQYQDNEPIAVPDIVHIDCDQLRGANGKQHVMLISNVVDRQLALQDEGYDNIKFLGSPYIHINVYRKNPPADVADPEFVFQWNCLITLSIEKHA
jgi:hypothetical protein